MTKGMKAPASITIEQNGIDRFTANWLDAEWRYHVWIVGSEKEIGDTIFKNPIEDRRDFNTIKLKLEKHPAILAAIKAATPAQYKQAQAKYAAEQAKEAADQREAWIARLREDAKRAGFKLVPIEGEQ